MTDQNETKKPDVTLDRFKIARDITPEGIKDPTLVPIDEWGSKIFAINQTLNTHYYTLRNLKRQIECEMSLLEQKQQDLKSVYHSMFAYYCNCRNMEPAKITPQHTIVRLRHYIHRDHYLDTELPPTLFEALKKHTKVEYVERYNAYEVDFATIVKEITETVAQRTTESVTDTIEPMIEHYGIELFTQIVSAMVDGKSVEDEHIYKATREWALSVCLIGRLASRGLDSCHVNSIAEYVMGHYNNQ